VVRLSHACIELFQINLT